MSNTYTAITLGPISDTMALTTSPAGLWGASGLFSWIAGRLLVNLVNDTRRPENFIVPWFALDDRGEITLKNADADGLCEEMRAKGIGMFHDRIIFEGNGLEDVKRATEKVVEELADSLPPSCVMTQEQVKTWLSEYLKVYAIVCDVPEGMSPILFCGGYLTTMELEPAFPASEPENPLLYLFENVSGGSSDAQPLQASALPEHATEDAATDPVVAAYSNGMIKKSFLVPGRDWILYKGGKNSHKAIRDLRSVAADALQSMDADWKKRKPSSYYAVLCSDGDNMTKVIERLKTEDIGTYSKKCLCFCANAAKLIQNYSGIPIYAGGDDLMALVPVIGMLNGKPATLIHLVDALSEAFNNTFVEEREALTRENKEREKKGEKPIPLPSFSAGLAVQFYRSPLYEAVERAEEMLRCAKNDSDKKNALRLNLQKHSGQLVNIAVDRINGTGRKTIELLEELADDLLSDLQKAKTAHAADREKEQSKQLLFLKSAGYHIEAFQKLFITALEQADSAALAELFNNTFDNSNQAAFEDYLKRLCALAIELKTSCASSKQAHEQLTYAVRFLHFLIEEGEENG